MIQNFHKKMTQSDESDNREDANDTNYEQSGDKDKDAPSSNTDDNHRNEPQRKIQKTDSPPAKKIQNMRRSTT